MKIKTVFTITIAIMLSIPVLVQADNCCGIDRQCTTDKEWADGYHAYHNGQCQAPVQEQTISPSPPVSESTSEIDNCCFIGWECHNDDDWKRGYNAYQNNQCGGNVITNTSIISLPSIEGSEWFRQQVMEGFEFLRVKSPKWFNYAASKLSRIVEAPNLTSKYGREKFAQVFVRERRVEISRASMQKGDWPLHTVLVHEACHVHQWDSGRYSSWEWSLSYDLEPECYNVQVQALSEMLPGSKYIKTLECFAEHHPFESFCGWFTSH